MSNELTFVTVQGGNMVRAMHEGRQLATADNLNGYWVAETHPNGTRFHGDTAQAALLLALNIRVQARIASGQFWAVQYTNGMISYEDKVKNG